MTSNGENKTGTGTMKQSTGYMIKRIWEMCDVREWERVPLLDDQVGQDQM